MNETTMNNIHELTDAISQYKNIIVYGAEKKGQSLLKYLKKRLPYSKIYVAISNTNGNILYCNNYLVRNIEVYRNLTDSCVVLIAARSIFHDDMEATAHTLGFKNVIRINQRHFEQINHNLIYEITSYDIISSLDAKHKKNQFLQYQAINLIRLNHLRNKVCQGKKVKVVFIVTSEAKFNFTSIYRAMEKNPLFEVVLFLYDEYYNSIAYNKTTGLMELNRMKEFANKLSHSGFNVIWGYDENYKAISIEEQEPDIVFYNNCYFSRDTIPEAKHHDLKKLVLNYLSCYISYGMLISNRPKYHFENVRIFPAWLFFVGNKYEYSLAIDNAITDGSYNVLSGHPLFDPYTIDKSDFSLPAKFSNKKKIIVYAPHWSLEFFKTSTFFVFGKYILSLLQKYPDIGFVFKPHPGLESWIVRKENGGSKNILKHEEYLEYCQTWENSPNGVIVTGHDYIEWFKNSDCLITDSCSFILSWLPTEKPCIYLKNPELPDYFFFDTFLSHIKSVLESYYLCSTENDIKKLIDDVVINGMDVKAEERKRQKEDVIYNLGHAGEYISNYIERKLRS